MHRRLQLRTIKPKYIKKIHVYMISNDILEMLIRTSCRCLSSCFVADGGEGVRVVKKKNK